MGVVVVTVENVDWCFESEWFERKGRNSWVGCRSFYRCLMRVVPVLLCVLPVLVIRYTYVLSSCCSESSSYMLSYATCAFLVNTSTCKLQHVFVLCVHVMFQHASMVCCHVPPCCVTTCTCHVRTCLYVVWPRVHVSMLCGHVLQPYMPPCSVVISVWTDDVQCSTLFADIIYHSVNMRIDCFIERVGCRKSKGEKIMHSVIWIEILLSW